MSLSPNKLPRTILSGEMPFKIICAIMIHQTLDKVLSLAYVKLSVRIFQDIHPKHKTEKGRRCGASLSKIGSAGKTRTYNPSVNRRTRLALPNATEVY